VTEHRFGSITGDEDTGGVVDITRAVSLNDYSVVAFTPQKVTAAGVARRPPTLALRLTGPLIKADETLDAVFLIDVHSGDAARLAGTILEGIHRAGGSKALSKALDDLIAQIAPPPEGAAPA
jgi:hypothetical protein